MPKIQHPYQMMIVLRPRQHRRPPTILLFHRRNLSNNNKNPSTTAGPKSNRKRRSSPSKKPTRTEKRISHIQKNIQHKFKLQRLNKRNEILTNVHKTTLKPITEIVTSDKFQTQVMDKLTSLQKQAQELILPDSLKFSRPSHEDRMRRAVVTDTKWWIGNIALSCLPAVLVALVCEYHTGEANEYFERTNRMNAGRQGMDADSVGERDRNDANGRDTKTKKNFLNEDDKGILDKVTEAINLLLFGIQPEIENGEEQSIPPSTEDEIRNDVEVPQVQESAISVPSNDTIKGKNETIHELLNRIKVLEDKLGIKNVNKQPQQSQQSTSPKEQTKDDMPKSNIRRRIEARNPKNQFEMNENDSIDQSRERQQHQQQYPQENIWRTIVRQMAYEKMNNLYHQGLNAIGMSNSSAEQEAEVFDQNHNDMNTTLVLSEYSSGTTKHDNENIVQNEMTDKESKSAMSKDSNDDNEKNSLEKKTTVKKEGTRSKIFAFTKLFDRKNDENN